MKILSETAYQQEVGALVDQKLAPIIAKNKALQKNSTVLRSALIARQKHVDNWRLGRMFMHGGGDHDIFEDPWRSAGAQAAGQMTPGQRSALASQTAAAGRSLYLRDAHASMAVELYVMFGIGNGLNYSFELPARDQDKFMVAWDEWWFSKQCSVGMDMTGTQIDRMGVRTEKGQGDCIYRFYECYDDWLKGRRAIPLGIEIMQTTRIDTSVNIGWNGQTRTYTKNGIRYNGTRAIQGIHLFPIEPGDGHSQSEYVPMWNDRIGQQLILYYDPKQPGVTRGVDHGGLLAYDYSMDSIDLRKETMRQQRQAARRGGVIMTDDDGSEDYVEGAEDEEFEIPEGAQVDQDGNVFDTETGQLIHEPLTNKTAVPTFEQIGHSAKRQYQDPGAIMTLPDKWKFEQAEPIDAPAYGVVQLDMQMAVSVAWKVPFPWLSGDASRGNMSSNKGIIQPFQREVEWTQENYINSVASIIARNAIIAANSVGIVRTGKDGKVPARMFKILGNVFPSSQPDKDARVSIMEWANLGDTFDEYLIKKGKDPKTHRATLKEDIAFYRELGIYEHGVPATISPQFTADFMRPGADETPTPQGGPDSQAN